MIRAAEKKPKLTFIHAIGGLCMQYYPLTCQLEAESSHIEDPDINHLLSAPTDAFVVSPKVTSTPLEKNSEYIASFSISIAYRNNIFAMLSNLSSKQKKFPTITMESDNYVIDIGNSDFTYEDCMQLISCLPVHVTEPSDFEPPSLRCIDNNRYLILGAKQTSLAYLYLQQNHLANLPKIECLSIDKQEFMIKFSTIEQVHLITGMIILCCRPGYFFKFADSHKPLLSLEQMTEHYTLQCEHYQKIGVVNLAGASSGGVIALQIARKLARKGRKSRVIMFDSWRYNGSFVKTSEVFCSAMMKLSGPLAPELNWLPYFQFQRVLQLEQFLHEELTPLTEQEESLIEVVLLKSLEPSNDFGPLPTLNHKLNCWEEICPKISLQLVPGNHHTMLQQPHIYELAKTVQGFLKQSKSVTSVKSTPGSSTFFRIKNQVTDSSKSHTTSTDDTLGIDPF